MGKFIALPIIGITTVAVDRIIYNATGNASITNVLNIIIFLIVMAVAGKIYQIKEDKKE